MRTLSVPRTQPPRERTYRAVVAAARGLFRALDLRISVQGQQHIPASGPVVVASNHVSFLDFTLVGLAAADSDRLVRFLARHDVWSNPVVRRLMDTMRHVPVDRVAPAAAYLRARSLLRAGEAVGIFPEAGVGTSYTVRGLMPGAVALAQETGAPLVPMAIWGPQRVLTAGRPVDLTRGRPVSLLVGEAVRVLPDEDVRERTAWLGHRLQAHLDALQARPEHQPRPGEWAPWHPAHLGGAAPRPEDAVLAESVPLTSVRAVWLPSVRAQRPLPTGRPRLPAMPEDATAPLRQRVAAYAVLLRGSGEAREVLLTRMSDRTKIAGRWTLPGGGLEHGEDPRDAVRREVLEETGLQVEPTRVLDTHSVHFTGPRADGLVEDYHGVHLIFAAEVAAASVEVEPHVLEQDSSTDLASWVPLATALDLPLLGPARHALTVVREAESAG